MCDELNNYQEMVNEPPMDTQNYQDENDFCPPSCNQCGNYQQSENSEYVCCEPNQNAQTDDFVHYEPQSGENYEQCFENCCGDACEIKPPCNSQEIQIDSDEHHQNYCPCPQKCQMPTCSPFFRRKYIQPPRTQSCKPIVCYQKPTIPFSNATIYKKSYECVDPKTASCCRMPPAIPRVSLKSFCGPFERETVTKLSFQPYCQVERTKPIFPQSRSMLGKGPMQELTTQKHDFVPKFQFRRSKIMPRDNIKRQCGCLEKTTIQRLSFIPPCVDGRRISFKPMTVYKKPEIPMERETTQKLSFMPVCPLPREELPWAKKPKYQPPTIGFAKDTVTKLSYQAPGCFIDECADPCQRWFPCEMPQVDC